MQAVIGLGEEPNELCPSLSYTNRMYGFGGCLAMGFLLGILSWISALGRNWVLFGLLMTCSNLCAIGGSFFLAGPLKQLKRMFEETRLIATIVYGVTMILTILAAVVVQSGGLVIFCCIVQYGAMVWYGLSYIPYARSLVKNCFKSAVPV
jgi:hypothetical protein